MELRWRGEDRGFPPKSLQFVQTFGQFNVCSPRVGNVSHRDTQLGPLGEGKVKLHPARFSLLAKRFEIRDFKSDVIQHATFGWHGRSIGFCKRQVYSRDVGGVELAPFPGLGAEGLDIPGLNFCYGSVSPGIRDKKMHVVKSNRHSERFIFQDFYPGQIVRGEQKTLPWILAELRLQTCGLPFGQCFRDIRYVEPNVIDHRSHGPAGRLAFPDEDKDTREFRSLIGAELERSTAHGDPEFFCSVHVLHEQMHVAHRGTHFIRRGQLRSRHTGRQKDGQAKHKHRHCISHFSLLKRISRMMKRQSFLKAEDATLAPGNQGLILNWGTRSSGGTILLPDVVFVSSTLSSMGTLYICRDRKSVV